MPTQLRPKQRVAFDTNMLLAIKQLKVDVFSEAKKMLGEKVGLSIPRQVLEEMHDLGYKNKNLEKSVGIALEEIKRCKVKLVDIDAANADEALAEMAKQGYFVASNDAVLRKRIKGFGGKVIYLRQRRFLESA